MSRVLVLGSGGREHALAWKFAKDEHEVLVAPGNAGTTKMTYSADHVLGNRDVSVMDFDAIADLIRSEEVDMTVVGPEAPLAAGLVDYLHGQGINRAVGPSAAAAQIEADKFYSHRIMEAAGVAQAATENCYTIQQTEAAIKDHRFRGKGLVLKFPGLAGGKGVQVHDSQDEALASLDEFVGKFCEGNVQIAVAERLYGQEFSVFGFSDGENVVSLPVSFQDHKPLLDGDKGPNTGGMGAYGPAPIADENLVGVVAKHIMTPVVQQMAKEGTPYKGVLYAGMMLTESGPTVIEFNCRFGDPETQPAMMLLQSDLYEVFDKMLAGTLRQEDVIVSNKHAMTIVMASCGYPGSYAKGKDIRGLGEQYNQNGTVIFHAGTKKVEGETFFKTNGGRVLGISALGDTLQQARDRAYSLAGRVSFEGAYMRRDIGAKALK